MQAQKIGVTKRNRGAKIPPKTDWRPPNTTKALVGKTPLPKQVNDSAALADKMWGSIYFQWAANSCYLDTALVLLDEALVGVQSDLQQVMPGDQAFVPLPRVLESVMDIYHLKKKSNHHKVLQARLHEQRDGVRSQLVELGYVSSEESFGPIFVSHSSQSLHSFES